MSSSELPWEKGAFWICTKCGKSLEPKRLSVPPDQVGENLKNFFKKQLAEKGLSKKIRVMTSSCFDICPVGEQAAVYIPKDSKQSLQVQIFDPETDKQTILSWLIQTSS